MFRECFGYIRIGNNNKYTYITFKYIRPDDIDNASSTYYAQRSTFRTLSIFPKYLSSPHLYHNLYVLRVQLSLTARASISRRLTISLSARFYRRIPIMIYDIETV